MIVFHDYLADKVRELEVAIEDLESVADTPGDFEALMRLTELRDRLATAGDRLRNELLLRP